MFPRWNRIWVLLCLVSCLNIAAGTLAPMRRQDAASTTITTQTSETGASSISVTSASSMESKSTEVTTTVSSATTAPSAINGNSPGNSTTYNNSTISPGELPLQPRLTPGWGIAGAIMLTTGAVYALIGIKNTTLHTFFSAAFLASLSTAVLIVYVMVLPVSDAIQGAYVVAVVCTGLILGGAATLFKELTEGLGCLLGGFCFAMWLLTLHDDGLITVLSGKIILIAVLSLVTFGLTFSHYTREYALIGSISFSGATVTVLGIDCFSRAGLKEFWAYIWAVNGNLFPLAAVTYPMTKGIRVELAATMILCFVGIVSQLKLWKVVQERRAKRAQVQAEAQRQRDVEEANLGQQIEEQTARERRQWEATYGDAPLAGSSISDDSHSQDMDEKKHRNSQTIKRLSTNEKDSTRSNSLISPVATPKETNDGLIATDESRVTVRVDSDTRAAHGDNLVPIPESMEKNGVSGADNETKTDSEISARNSQRLSRSNVPELVPLPFHIPDEATGDEDDRSSIATFADDDGSVKLGTRGSLNSLGNRLSISSGNLLRSLSQRSQRSTKSKKGGREISPVSHVGESREGLVKSRNCDEDAGSMAAMVDDMSVSSDERQSIKKVESGRPLELAAQLSDTNPGGNPITATTAAPKHRQLDTSRLYGSRPISDAETVATDILTPPGSQQDKTGAIAQEEEIPKGVDSGSKSETPKQPRSETPSTASTPGSLTKDRLPSGLSKIALSFRTNEWAKHLSQAETPELEKLILKNNQDAQEKSLVSDEVTAPVDLESLQQTAMNGTPAPARRLSMTPSNDPTLSRPSSQTSMNPSTHNRKRASTLSVATSQAPDTGTRTSPVKSTFTNPSTNPTGYAFRSSRRASRDMIAAPEPIAEEHGEEPSVGSARNSLQPDDPILARRTSWTSPPLVAGVVSYSSPQTLLGQREMLLRNKSQTVLPAAVTPDMVLQYAPQPPSEVGSLHNYPMYKPYAAQDVDDIPLSQRKHLMRQSSMMSMASASAPRPASNLAMTYGQQQQQQINTAMTPAAEAVHFDSHQPLRHSKLPSQVARQAQLASFRQSVANDLRTSTFIPPGGSGRETPLVSPSMTSLIQGVNGSPIKSEGEVRHSLEQSRNMMLNQREAEAQRRAIERKEKERSERLFEERMRNGDLIDAHREAMRRMQSAARGQ